MKKITRIFAIFLLAIMVVACNSSSNEIKPSQVQEKIDAKDTFIVVVSSTTCSACKQYKPVVSEFLEKTKDVDLQEVVIDKLNDQEEKTDFLTKYAITGTPTTLFFKDGKLVTMVGEVISEDKLESLYDEYLK